ncbi:MAG: hypothetical protein LLG00_02205 [Planctomycetaceae bacterium]|nr:hypothetical protein [Planctomycetaceae bacterium]
MTTNWNRREVLASLMLAAPGAATLAAAIANVEPTVAGEPASATSSKQRRRIAISKETTYITEPLAADGYPDYVGALNQLCSKGVTPENNAAVLVAKAIGPGQLPAERRDKYFSMLGISPLPTQGEYFVSRSEHAGKHSKKDGIPDSQYEDRLLGQVDAAGRQPWSKSEFPVWAEWLAANEQPMALLMEASKRPYRYDPWFWDKDGDNIDVGSIPMSQYRDAAKAFALRSMLRLGSDQVDAAIDDVQCIRRLSRLIGRGPTLVEMLIGITIDGVADESEYALLTPDRLSTATLDSMRRAHSGLPPVGDAPFVLGIGERFFVLSSLSAAARKPIAEQKTYLAGLEGLSKLIGDEESKLTPIVDEVGNAKIDWDVVLRTANAWIDRLVAALAKSDIADRTRAVADIKSDLDSLKLSLKKRQSLKSLPRAQRRAAGSDQLARAVVATCLPSFLTCRWTMTNATARRDLTRTAYALAQHHLDRGTYPPGLEQLTPRYLPAVPKDVFASDANLHYSREADGCLLYSVGPNGRDDGGRTAADWSAAIVAGQAKPDDVWDDLVVRIPVPRH